MIAPKPPIAVTQDSEFLSLIHPDLRPNLLGIRFDELTPEDISRIFSENAETILSELVRSTRARGLLA